MRNLVHSAARASIEPAGAAATVLSVAAAAATSGVAALPRLRRSARRLPGSPMTTGIAAEVAKRANRGGVVMKVARSGAAMRANATLRSGLRVMLA